MLLIKLAWRNILRNKKRMIPAGLAIAIGLAALMALDGLVAGMKNNMIINATNTFIGHGQIHAKGFRQTMETENIIKNIKSITAGLNKEKEVKAYTLRTENFAMLSSASGVESIILFGIDPEKETAVSQIKDVIIKGDFLENDDLSRILIGKKLAEILDLTIGDRIVLTVAQAETGELSQELFRVGGIFKFSIRQLDSGAAFINIDKSRKMLGIGGGAHGIVLKFNKLSDIENPLLNFWARYSTKGNEALTWKEILPGIEGAVKMSSFSTLIMGVLLLAVVAVVVMNTLFMSLYERMREFGILRAIGTRPSRMTAMILAEACVLCLISIIIGLISGCMINGIASVIGIDYTGLEMGNITFREPIRPVITLKQLTLFPVFVFIFTLIAAVFPALNAAKLAPAEAMKQKY